MKVYYTGGTIGDAYVILCKLYSVAKREEILCRHYTEYKETERTIQEIYSLLPNIKVEFLKNKPSEIQICGAFRHLDKNIEWDKYELKPEYYPEFELGSVKRFDLPENYITIQLTSGLREDRKLLPKEINKIMKRSKYPVITVGKNGNKTSIKEVISIIKESLHFYGPQGFLSFVAVSQKVLSTIYIKSEAEVIAVQRRIEAAKEWKKFLIKKE